MQHDTPPTDHMLAKARAIREAANARPTLNERTDGVNERLDTFDQLLAELEHRLEPVLRPTIAHAVDVPADRTEDGSWLADYLFATSGRLERLVDSLRELTDRVEL